MKNHTESLVESSYKSVAKGSAVLFVAILAMRVLGYVSRLLMARLLGKESYGLITLSVSTLEVITLLSVLGFPIAVQRFIGYYSGLKDQLKIKNTIFSVFQLSIPSSVLIASILFFLADGIANEIYKKPDMAVILKVFAVALPLVNVRQIFEAIFQGFKKSVFYIGSYLSTFIFVPTIFLLLYALGFRLKAAYSAYFIAYVLSFSISLFFIFKLFRQQNLPSGRPQSIIGEIFSYSWPLIFNSMLWFLMVRIDTLMLGYFSEASAVGVYNASTPIAQFVGLFLQSFGFLFLPVISEIYSQQDFESLQRLYDVTLKWITVLTVPVFLFLFVCPRENLIVFFGVQYSEADQALKLISIGYFMNAVIGLQSWILSASGKTKQLFLNSLTGLILNTILNYTLIPRFGINGAATATAMTLTIFNLIGVLQIQKYFQIRTLQIKNLFILVLGVATILVAKTISNQIVNLYSIMGLVLCFFLYLLLYFVSLPFIKFFSPEDRIIIRIIENKTGMNLSFLDRFVS